MLIGDAAQSMRPDIGMGTSTALEDGFAEALDSKFLEFVAWLRPRGVRDESTRPRRPSS